jgi:hypothetical protein
MIIIGIIILAILCVIEAILFTIYGILKEVRQARNNRKSINDKDNDYFT